MSWRQLPNEIILMVFDSIENDDDTSVANLHALSLTCRTFHAAFNPALYRLDWKKSPTRYENVFSWAIEHRREHTASRVIEFCPESRSVESVSDAIDEGMVGIANDLLSLENVRAELLGDENKAHMPMFAAVRQGFTDLFDRMVAVRSPNYNLYEDEGMTLLQTACYEGQLYFVRRFLDEGVDPAFEDGYDDMTPLSRALSPRKGWKRHGKDIAFVIVQEILNRSTDMAVDVISLRQAALEGQDDVLSLLLERGGQLPSGNAEKLMLLMATIKGGNTSILKQLVALGPCSESYGGYVELISSDFWSPLHIVAGDRSIPVEMAQLLTASGAKLCGKELKSSVLDHAVWADNVPMVRFCLNEEAHLLEGQLPPFHRAQSIEMVHLLRKYNFDIDDKGSDGHLPVQKLVEVPYSGFYDACKMRFGLFVDLVTHVDAVNHKGQTALFSCCGRGYRGKKAVLKLLRRNASPSMADYQGRTPLHEAAFYGDLELLELLLIRNANLDAVDNKGFTPLHDLMQSCSGDDTEFVQKAKWILQRGADPNARSHHGTFAVHAPLRISRGGTEGILLFF
jgi:ankyrin repeat protein